MSEIKQRVRWRDRYCDDGICDFRMNYEFYFKWLTNKVMQLFCMKGLDGTNINDKTIITCFYITHLS